ncbi:Mobile element protein [Caenispirillum salinarum AK4]|uniref:Mobile element protein n=1 Tax=Caenispirillum salinarum AK4 TaxID=1238182 RepID=K9GQC7_9PROT|nr:Mobile element protein [Caenispirillum salinarum AK4]
MDNVFIERLWRSMKYECIYLHALETDSGVREELGRWIAYYNMRRPHSALPGRTPDEAYRQIAPTPSAACDPETVSAIPLASPPSSGLA